VHDAAAVRVRDGVRDLRRVVQRRLRGKALSRRNQRREQRPLDVLHHDERLIAEIADFVDAADGRVVQRGGEARFLQQPPRGVRVGAAAIHDFDRHGPLEVAIVCAIHDAHPAGAEQRFDPVTVRSSWPMPMVRSSGADMVTTERRTAGAYFAGRAIYRHQGLPR